jgi:myosin heavy subunit
MSHTCQLLILFETNNADISYVTESCYQELSLNNAVNQSVVISGESGSGKTETAKMVLGYLVSRLDGSSGGSAKNVTSIDNRLIQSSPVLEAFGNSSTLRNPNSSRFGKFLKLGMARSQEPTEFQRSSEGVVNGRIVGATVETYLLEKSRVIHQSKGEQNFHVFYQLLAGQESGVVDSIGGVSDYRILNEYTSGDVKGLRDQFVATRYALETVGYDSALQSEVWRTLAGVLALGNVQFDEVDSSEGGVASVASNGALESAASYWGVSTERLVDVLTMKVMRARGEEFTIRLTVNDACFARDAVCKTIYDALFMDIVKCVNSSLTGSASASADENSEMRYIGVLDIFGFESFAVNRFDQLLINYANESLQNTFNVQVFKSELMLLVEENIECALDPSMCPDNSGCVETIWVSAVQLRGGECSVLTTLDAVSRQPKPLDDKFCSQLHADFSKATSKQKYFPPPHPKDKRSTFLVKHFAGVVKYTVGSGEDSWVAKNNDASPDNLASILSESRYTVVSRLLAAEGSFGQVADARRGQINKSTIASSFAKSMALLDNELQSTRCAFVRCIKPNASMVPAVFDNAYVVEQMRALGLVQACEVMRVGLPNRMTYVDLKAALAPIVAEVEAMCAGESEEVLVASLLQACEVEDDSYRLGKTRVFFKPGKLAALEASIQRAAGSGRKEEMLHRLKSVLSNRRELQQSVQKVKDSVAAVEAEVASGWAELDALQKSVASGPQDSSSTCFAITSSEATSAVDYLGALIDASAMKVTDVRSLLRKVEGNSEYDEVRAMLEDVDKEMSDLESAYRSIKMKHGSLSTQGRGKKTELHEAALDRWQDMSRVDDNLKTLRNKVRNMEGAATKFQADKVSGLSTEVTNSLQVIRSGLADTLTLVRESMSQLGSASSESTRLIGIAKGIIDEARDLTGICESICDSCSSIKKQFDALQIKLAEHEEERRQREQEQRARDDSLRLQEEEKSKQEAESACATQNRRGSVRGLNVAALRKNLANMSVDKTTAATNKADVEGIPPPPPAAPPVDDWVLPAGWEEYFDASFQLPYYFNAVTQETQWERPDAPASSVGGQINVVETHTESIPVAAAVSAVAFESAPAGEGGRATRASVAPFLGKNTAASKCSLSYGRITTSQLDSLGVEVKKGVLMKKGSAGLARFKRKYFVLEGPVLTYYDKAEQYLCGSGGGKEMRLSIASSTSYTDQECTFIVKSPQLVHEKELSWQLVAESVTVMHEWVTYINAHIHAIHRNQQPEGGDASIDEYASMGTVETAFWRLPIRNEYGPITNPVGIRSTPNAHGNI